MSVKYDFSGSRVLVTGGAGALGQSTVLKFLESGATVVVLDKDTTNIHELLQQYPTCLETITVDLTNWEETAKAISQTLPIHHLVNNAGIPGPALPFLQIRPEDVDKVLDINFKAMINVSQAVAAGMIEGNFGGTIVNISSVMSSMAYKKLTLYCASKAAVSMLTKSMALELAQHNIRVNSISPTIMATNMTMPAPANTTGESSTPTSTEKTDNEPRITNLMRTLLSKQIVKRFLTTEETANLILYLSSTASEMIVGEDIFIDAGIFSN